jgi:hypothetical protein
VQISVEHDDVSIYADDKQNIERAIGAITTHVNATITTPIKYEIYLPMKNLLYNETTQPLQLGIHRRAITRSITPAPSPSITQVPRKVTEMLALTANQLMRLQKASGGWFSFWRTAPIDRIQADTDTSITVMPNNSIAITGHPSNVAHAKKLIAELKE